jgi:hypothetical protein
MLGPKSTEAQIIVLYYARVIRIYHAKSNGRDYLKKRARLPRDKAGEGCHSASPCVSAQQYSRNPWLHRQSMGNRKRKIVPRPRRPLGGIQPMLRSEKHTLAPVLQNRPLAACRRMY